MRFPAPRMRSKEWHSIRLPWGIDAPRDCRNAGRTRHNWDCLRARGLILIQELNSHKPEFRSPDNDRLLLGRAKGQTVKTRDT